MKHPRINFDFNLQLIAALYEPGEKVELTSVFMPLLGCNAEYCKPHPGCHRTPVGNHSINICMHFLYWSIFRFIALLFVCFNLVVSFIIL